LRRSPKKKTVKYYRLNFRIVASKVRVIDEKGGQLGVFTRDEALRRARELGVDLVEVASSASPPVCRLMDFKKFKYLEAKREREQKKKSKDLDLKELKLTPFMGEHDLAVRVKRAREMLGSGHRLKLWVQFKGRQFRKKEYGYDILKRMFAKVSDIANLEQGPKMTGRKLISFIIPVKKGADEKEKIKDKNSSSQKV